eukprot:gene10087-11117_t
MVPPMGMHTSATQMPVPSLNKGTTQNGARTLFRSVIPAEKTGEAKRSHGTYERMFSSYLTSNPFGSKKDRGF